MDRLRERIEEKIRELLALAGKDIRFGRLGLAEPEADVFELVAFHAQQAVEKSLKAYLIFRGVDFPYTHNLVDLLDLCRPIAKWAAAMENIKVLTKYAVTPRYSSMGRPVTEEDATHYIMLAEHLRETVKTALRDEGLEIE